MSLILERAHYPRRRVRHCLIWWPRHRERQRYMQHIWHILERQRPLRQSRPSYGTWPLTEPVE